MNWSNISRKIELAAREHVEEKEYWLSQLDGFTGSTGFPGDLSPPGDQTGEAAADYAQYRFAVDDDMIERLNKLSNGSDHALHIILMAAVTALLYKTTGQPDIVTGTPVYRHQPGEDEEEAELMNTCLPVRCRLIPGMTFKQLLLKIKETVLQGIRYQGYPIEMLPGHLGLEEDRFPLFDVGLMLESIHELDYISHLEPRVLFSFPGSGSGRHAVIRYPSAYYTEAEIEPVARYFQALLRAVLPNIDISLAEVDILGEEERKRLLYDFNDTQRAYPHDIAIHELFKRQAAQTPEAAALIGPSLFSPLAELSYRELDRCSDALAARLRDAGVLPGGVAGIFAETSVEMIIGVIAVLKCGGAYMPISPGYPASRTGFMLNDGSVQLILADTLEGGPVDSTAPVIALNDPGIYQMSKAGEPFDVDRQEKDPGEPCRDLAYIMYTSGSTGLPKGVMVEHVNVVRLVKNTAFADLYPGRRLLQTGVLQFDASTFEIWGMLLNGGTLVLEHKEKLLSPSSLKDILTRNKIDIIWMTSPLFNQMLQEDIEIFKPLSTLVVGGDALSPAHIDRVREQYPGLEVINGYGPTENTTFSTTFRIDRQFPLNIPVGAPITNSTAYIIPFHYPGGPEPFLLPLGAPGELVVGGDGVARGYLNNPDFTAEKFIPNPFVPGDRLYRTGDMARWLPDGNIQFLGRKDFQVKIRGFRVELKEIENALLKFPGIKDAFVMARRDHDGDNTICAYFTPENETDAAAELTAYFTRSFPGYMVPSHFVKLDKIPLNANGKVETRELPDPGSAGDEAGYTAPRTEMEEQLETIWHEVLGIDKRKIGIGNNFFDLGGHSLKVIRMIARIQKQFHVLVPLEEIFRLPDIRKLAQYIEEKSSGPGLESYTAIPLAEQRHYYPLSSAQRRLFVLCQMEKEMTAYNIPAIWAWKGEPDRERLLEAFRTLIHRHDSFRTSFHMIGGEPMQRVHDRADFDFSYPGTVSITHIKTFMDDFMTPFDLSRAPLLRACIAETGAGRFALVVDVHHIIADGLSFEIFKNEITECYQSRELAALPLQYKDFALWQAGEKERGSLARQAQYWLDRFSDDIPVLNLPLDFPRPAVQDFHGSRIDFRFNNKVAARLIEIAREQSTTTFMVLLSLFNILLSRLSGQEDIVAGTPVSGRKHVELEGIIGMFVNTLALRHFPSGNLTFKEFLSRVTSGTLDAFEHQDYQFEDLVELLSVPRDTGRNPLFDVMFAFQNISSSNRPAQGSPVQSLAYDVNISKFDMTLTAYEFPGGLRFSLEYCTRLFKEETVRRFTGYFERIAAAVVRDIKTPLSRIDIISEDERAQILDRFSAAPSDYPRDKTIHQLFEREARLHPGTMAVSGISTKPGANPGLQITYGELDRQSNGAVPALKNRGAGTHSIVGIMADRSVEMVIAILGILKAGGAYFPVAPGYPEERLSYMIHDVGCSIMLAQPDCIERAEAVSGSSTTVVDMNSILPRPNEKFSIDRQDPGASAGSLAYIIYTSGSTGWPKGVMVEHRAVVRLVKNSNYVEFKPGDRILQTGALEFDASTFEIWGSLLNRMGLIMVDRDSILAPSRLKDTLLRFNVTTMWMTSPLFNRMIQADTEMFGTLGQIIVGGDALSPVHINALHTRFPHVAIFNGYGPTENTTFSVTHRIGREYYSAIPIGRPISNSTAYIISPGGHLQPIGVPGELLVGGDGLARGYLNNPELTVEKFIDYINHEGKEKAHSSKLIARREEKEKAHSSKLIARREEEGKKLTGTNELSFPMSCELRATSYLYRTGDLARWLADGCIEFLGRIDQQLKIRGFRIEPEEIGNRLLARDDIQEAFIMARSDESGEKYLCAYIVPSQSKGVSADIPASTLISDLSRDLPDYMIPSYFVQLDKLPLNLNGKIDRRLLPPPGKTSSAPFTGPRDEVEKKMADIWSGVLNIEKDKIGIDDGFFELGGQSLKAVRMISLVHQAFDVQLLLSDVFKTPVIRELSRMVRTGGSGGFASVEPVEEQDYYPLSSAQKRLYIIQKITPGSLNYNMPIIMPWDGDPEPGSLEAAFKHLIRRHESFRTSFKDIDEEPVQVIAEPDEIEFEILTLEPPKDTGGYSPLTGFVRPFDLSAAPLLRAGFMKLDAGRGLLMVDMHHIISDGMSIVIFKRELESLTRGETLQPLRVRYRDYAQWHNKHIVDSRFNTQETFWMETFAGEIPVLAIPVDFPRPEVKNFAGKTAVFPLDHELGGQLRAIARQEDVTIFMLLMALFNVFLGKLGGQEDIVVGTPTAARKHVDLEGIIGMFVNTLALRYRRDPAERFDRFLSKVKHTTVQAFENQDYPFELLVEKVDVARDTSRNPLFDVMFTLNDLEANAGGKTGDDNNGNNQTAEEPAKGKKSYSPDSGISKFDITFHAYDDGQKLALFFEYSTELFKEETIRRYFGYLDRIARAVALDSGVKTGEIEIISPEEKQRIIREFNATEADFPSTATIVQLFEKTAARVPDRPAIETDDGSNVLTYNQLDAKSAHLARLLAEKGIGPERLVGIMAERSLEMMTGIFGILKAGAAYLPIEPTYPDDRIRFLLADSGVNVVAATRKTAQDTVLSGYDNIETIYLEDIMTGSSPQPSLPAPQAPGPENPAYVIYTSGSTGKPKGVLVEHRSVINRIHWMQRRYPLDESDVILQKTTIMFDVSVWELFWWSFEGATLRLLTPGGEKDPEAIMSVIHRANVTTMHFVPSMLGVFLDWLEENGSAATLSSLRRVFSSGEALANHHAERFNRLLHNQTGARLINLYGPTEATVDVSYYDCPTTDDITLPSIPIGKPIDNIQLYVMDKFMNHQPIGVSGELYITGTGVARGYLNRPDMTADRFEKAHSSKLIARREEREKAHSSKLIARREEREKAHSSKLIARREEEEKKPIGTNEPSFPTSYQLPATSYLYKTGDLVRWLADGNIEYLGRIDHQVKIRGFRIELGEIETLLLGCPGVKEGVVIDRVDPRGEKFLCAYYTGSCEAGELREHLARALPEYMVPAFFVSMDALPLTANGKLNRRALPEPSGGGEQGEDFVAPGTGMEEIVAAVWKEILGVDQIGINDRFFNIGGNSLNIIRMNTRLNKQLGTRIPVVLMFRYTTIKELAQYLAGYMASGTPGTGHEPGGHDNRKNNMEEPTANRTDKINKAKSRRIQRIKTRKGD